MTHTQAKGQGQRSIGLKDRMETDERVRVGRRTKAIALPAMLTRSVSS